MPSADHILASSSASVRRGAGYRKVRDETVTYTVLVLASAFALLPLAWGLSTSLKAPAEIAAEPKWLPAGLYLGNYVEAFRSDKFLQYLFNSSLVLALTLVFSVALAAHAAYVVSRREFPGKSALMFLVWSTIMIPGVAVIVPLYLLSVKVYLYDTYAVLVLVYSSWLVPTLIWLLKGFIDAVPFELEESALIDGCGQLGAFYRVVFPLLKPGLAAGSVLVFVMVWNDFIIGYAVTLTDPHRMVQVGLYFFVTEVGISWGPLMAATMIALAPIVIAFGLLQRQFIQGIAGGSVKG